jgi:hypothetical protein
MLSFPAAVHSIAPNFTHTNTTLAGNTPASRHEIVGLLLAARAKSRDSKSG